MASKLDARVANLGVGLSDSGGVLTNTKPVSGPVVNTTSGTSIDLVGIPTWATVVHLVLSEVSTNAVNPLMVRLGSASGGIETTGYVSATTRASATGSTAGSATDGIRLANGADSSANNFYNGVVTLRKFDGNRWVSTAMTGQNVAFVNSSGAAKTLSAPLDRIRLMSSTGTDTFDNGSIKLMWE